MYERRTQKLAPRRIFVKRVILNIFFGSLIIALSLWLGMMGYRHFENMTWIDAFANASMILSGMGPLDPLHSENGKLFAGCYALFSGIIFLVVIALIFAPIYHRFFHEFHLEDPSHQ